MKTAYFDLIAGASGDMIMGALVDSGLVIESLRQGLSALRLDDFQLKVQQVSKNGFRATKIDVVVKDDVPERHLSEIQAIITNSDLPNSIQEKANNIFHRLGEVEAHIHGSSLENVHLHELGGVDTIVDVVGVLVGLEALGIQRIITSPVPLGRGFIKGAHGQIPLPAPATAALLKGFPVVGVDLQVETVTPTGAVLLTSLSNDFGPIPPLQLETIGYGAGGRDLPIPNLIRLFIGEYQEENQASLCSLVMLDTNIDDMNPEIYNFLLDRLFESGALDVFFTPIQMKKNRPATRLQVLAKPRDSYAMRKIIFEETSTLGIRQQLVERFALERETRKVETAYGPVRVKIAHLGNQKTKFAPEFEDCCKIAQDKNIPLQKVYLAAETAVQASLESAG